MHVEHTWTDDAYFRIVGNTVKELSAQQHLHEEGFLLAADELTHCICKNFTLADSTAYRALQEEIIHQKFPLGGLSSASQAMFLVELGTKWQSHLRDVHCNDSFTTKVDVVSKDRTPNNHVELQPNGSGLMECIVLPPYETDRPMVQRLAGWSCTTGNGRICFCHRNSLETLCDCVLTIGAVEMALSEIKFRSHREII